MSAAVPEEGQLRGASSAGAQRERAALEGLLERMRGRSDFPALTESVARIQSMTMSDNASISSVTNEILKDVALTNKLLRVVNSAHYARNGSVGTVSRAVSLVGFNGIRNMTLSLVLLEHMRDKTNAQFLKEEFLRALMAGTIAAELSSQQLQGEEAFIGALFQHLGRMLAQFYFTQEAATIRELVADTSRPVTEDAAAALVLGLSYEALGLGVARAWGLPDSIQHCIARPVGEPPAHPAVDAASQLRWSARAANDMADALLHSDPADVERQLGLVCRTYCRVLGMAPERVKATTIVAQSKLVELADAMEIHVAPQARAARLLRPSTEGDERVAPTGQTPAEEDFDNDLLRAEVGSAPALPDGHPHMALDSRELDPHEQALQTLTAGIQDVTNVMVDDFRLSDVLRMILEAMYRGLGFHRVVFCMRDPKVNALTGRFGLGPDVEGVVKSFWVSLESRGVPDLFATICSKAADTLINDTTDSRIAARLPAWYQRDFHAAGFLILPLVIKGQAVGLIYADALAPGQLSIDERQLSLLRTLRNQAVMAFRQST